MISGRFVSIALAWILAVAGGRAIADGESARELASEFRRAGGDPARRAELVDRAAQAGPRAAGALRSRLVAELRADLARYRAQLTHLASAALRERRTSRREVETLRDTVLSLGRDPGLSHERLVTDGAPALDRLVELLVVPPHEVSRELAAEREALERRGAWFDRLEAVVASERRIEDGKPPEPSTFEEILERNERLATALAMKTSRADRRVLEQNEELSWEIDAGEALGILDLNVTRMVLGLSALRIDPRLCAAARDHSNDMRTEGFFSHTSPVPGKTSFSDRASRFRASASSENIASGYRDPAMTNRNWFLSPGHHRNMLGGHGRVGLGRSDSHWTQMFG